MNLVWHEAEASIKPKELELDISPTTVFLRRNIEKVTKENDDGSTYTAYTYEEATVLKTEYSAYLASQNEANIEYIACMSDIEL